MRGTVRGLAVALVAALVWATPSAALGYGGNEDLSGAPVTTSATSARVHRCTLFASEVTFGARCSGGARGPRRTWREKLAGHPLVTCHDEPVPDGVRLPPEPADGHPGAYSLETCVVDFDLDAVHGGPGAHPETKIVWIRAGDRVLDVPPWMTWLWAGFTSAYPTPVLTTGPTAYPRVNVPAYFWLTPASAAPMTRVLFDGRSDLTMSAELVQLQVRPGVADDEPAVACGTGTDVYDTRRSPYEQTSTCTYTYERSSAVLPGQAYPLAADAYWRVGYTDDRGYHQLGLFDVSTVQLLPVQEVQSVLEPAH